MKPPCMMVVQYILPALRVEIAKELSLNYKLKNAEVARKMDVTPAAVTQYLNRSRGGDAADLIQESKKVMGIVSEVAKDIVEEESPPDMLLMKLCKACLAVRSEKLMCEIHMESMPSLKGLESCACSLGLVGWSEESKIQAE
jgi:predicted transcriptional regulator